MDHPSHMADFEEDDNGLFKTYFNFCDVEQDGVLTTADDTRCKAMLRENILERLEK